MQKNVRRNVTLSSLLQLAVALPLVLCAGSASAHISVDMGGTHKSRYSDDGLKDSPCGMTGGTRGTNVYKYKPGATINVSIVETIPHPGYFRISFDNDGDDGFKIPAGTDGKDGNCAGDPKCGAGKADFCNSDTVLYDQLDQHASGALGKKYTWSVTLPNIECKNCTLQIIQMMNDFNFHPSPFPADDIYYQCIDIELSKDAPDVTDVPVKNNGMSCKGGETSGAAGSAGSASAAGTSAAAGAGGSSAGSAGSVGSAGANSATAGSSSATAGSSSGGAAGGVAVATAAGGSPATMTSGAAGKPSTSAPTTSAAGSGAGSAVSAQTGTAGTSASAPTTSAPASSSGSSGGCQVAAGSSAVGMFGPLALGLLTMSLRGRRRRTRG